jgi:amino acid transporter
MINGIIGAGIFGLPSKVHALVGVHGLFAFAVCALIIAAIALCCAEVASRFQETGGAYLYTQRAFGSLPAFAVGWLMWVTRMAAMAVMLNVAVSYLSFFWEPATTPIWRALIMTALTAALTVANLRGVRNSAVVCNVLTIGKLTPLLLFALAGIFFIDPSRFALGAAPQAQPFTQAVMQLIFAFAGFEATVIAAGEMRNPQRNLPFAMLVAIGGVTVLYLLIQIVCIGTLPELASTERPLADASLQFLGAAGASLIAAGALISTLGTYNGIMLLGPRLLYAMAENSQIPRLFARVHPRFHTPHAAILLTAFLGLVLSISGSFTYLLTLGVIARLLTYIVTAAALLVFRRRPHMEPAHFRVPGGAVFPVLTLALCAWLIVNSGARELRDVGIAIAIGLVLFAIFQRRRTTR